MKRTKFLALVLVVAIMMMGAGYAAWTDLIEVTGTVDTGTMDVNVQWASLTKPDYTTGSISNDENSITFNVGDLYPTTYKSFGEGSSQTFARVHYSIKNEGTVPVKLDSIEFIRENEDSIIWDWMRTRVHIHKGTPSATGTSLHNSTSLTGTNALAGDLKDLDKLLMGTHPTDKTSILPDVVLMPGEAIWFGGNTEDESSIRFFLDPNAPNETQNEEIGLTLKFNWKQFNM